LMGDLDEWTTITLDDEHASTADVKAGVEQVKGTRPVVQELFRYDESWTGTAVREAEGAAMAGHAAHAGHRLARGAAPAPRAGRDGVWDGGRAKGSPVEQPARAQGQVVMPRTNLRLTADLIVAPIH
jgi:hypothetical protein